MEYLGLALGLIVGLLLGLLGGGGSIMAVPIFVYLFGLDAKLAIATSLVVVGATSLVGTLPHYRAGNVDLRRAIIFILGSTCGAFVGSRLSTYFSGAAQLSLFACVMLTSSIFMLRPRSVPHQEDVNSRAFGVGKYLRLLALATMVGILTGIVGVGGGFLIVPTLVLLAGIDMKKAIGTSLLVIALNSISAFSGYITSPVTREAIVNAHIGGYAMIPFLLVFMMLTFLGVGVGSMLTQKVNAQALRRAFGYFLILMATLILVQNSGVLR